MCHTEVEGVKQPLVEKNDRRTAADPYAIKEQTD
jgi:hypothetical protein